MEIFLQNQPIVNFFLLKCLITGFYANPIFFVKKVLPNIMPWVPKTQCRDGRVYYFVSV